MKLLDIQKVKNCITFIFKYKKVPDMDIKVMNIMRIALEDVVPEKINKTLDVKNNIVAFACYLKEEK